MQRKARSSPRSKGRPNDEVDATAAVAPAHPAAEEGRTILLIGPVEGELTKHVVERLFTLSEQSTREPIYMVIHTEGGYVDDMFCIYDAMKFIPAPVYTIGLGLVASAGVLLLAAGEKGHRSLGRHARIMHHLGWNDGVMGNVFEQKNYLKEMERQEDLADSCLARECNRDVAVVKDWLKERLDRYIMPDEAIELGLIDRVIE